MDPEVLYLPQMSIECELWGTFVEFQQMVCPTSTNKIKLKKKRDSKKGQICVSRIKNSSAKIRVALTSVWRCCLIFLTVYNYEKQSLEFALCRSLSASKTIISHREFTWTAAQKHSNNAASNTIKEMQAFCSKHKCLTSYSTISLSVSGTQTTLKFLISLHWGVFQQPQNSQIPLQKQNLFRIITRFQKSKPNRIKEL